MAVERVSGGSSLIDVLDRVLDKGIVIDAWVRISLVGIDLITVEARVVVASIDTYLKYADAVGLTGLVSRPQLDAGEPEIVEVVESTRRPAKKKKTTVRRTVTRR
jgi:gas vesicle structural protein